MPALRLTPENARPAAAGIRVNGADVAFYAGDSLAACLMAAGILRLRNSPRDGSARGAFCFMGVCQECLVHVDGVLRQACLVQVRPGMEVAL